MKAKIILESSSRRMEMENVVGEGSVAMDTQTEQYSPSDFINRSAAVEMHGTRGVQNRSPNMDLQKSVTCGVSPPVIRPIPIMPFNPSIFNTQPTYFDRLHSNDALATFSSTLLCSELAKNDQDSVTSSKAQGRLSPSSLALVNSDSGSEEFFQRSNESHRCRWLNCENRFSTMDDLVQHVNDHHVRVERPDVEYQCKWGGCPRKGKGFNARYKMLIHIRTHTNEKPHRCSLCGKSFSRLENLKIHMRSHTGEKPYACPFSGCNKAYSNSSDRFKHVRTHQEDKPYLCKMDGCNKRYTDPSSLRKHVRIHGHYAKDVNPVQSSVTSTSVLHTQDGNQNGYFEDSDNSKRQDFTRHVLVSVNSGLKLPTFVISNGFNQSVSATLQFSSLISNPLFSSTLESESTHFKQTHSRDGPAQLPLDVLKCGSFIQSVTNERVKIQDGPLDLSTSPKPIGSRPSSPYLTSPGSRSSLTPSPNRRSPFSLSPRPRSPYSASLNSTSPFSTRPESPTLCVQRESTEDIHMLS